MEYGIYNTGLSCCGLESHDNITIDNEGLSNAFHSDIEIAGDCMPELIKRIRNSGMVELLPIEHISFNGRPAAALIDTGAEMSCVNDDLFTEEIFKEMNPVGEEIIHSIAFPEGKPYPVYNLNIAWNNKEVYEKSFPHNFAAIPMADNGENYFAIIGRDILRYGTFTYDPIRNICIFDRISPINIVQRKSENK